MEAIASNDGVAVASDSEHRFSKRAFPEIELVAGIGVAGDSHSGRTVQHRSRVAIDPAQPNLRQVHLIHVVLFAFLAGQGFKVSPGDLGENITTTGIDLLGLPQRTRMFIGGDVKLEITGLRNPCSQIENFQPGLLGAVVKKNDDGAVIRMAGIMAIVLKGGIVRTGDALRLQLPPLPHHALERV